MKVKMIAIIGICIAMYGCNKDKENAQLLLSNAKTALSNNDFAKAKADLDSLNTKYPRAFDERKESITLLDSIRLIENSYLRDILDNKKDSIQKEISVTKEKFKYSKNEKYQETGVFIPKVFTSNLNSTTLESGVYESGKMYLKSIFLGSQSHDRIKATSNNLSVETLPIEMDGFVHRFNSLGRSYEVIYVQENYNNGIFSFLNENIDNKIVIELLGKKSIKYELNKINKIAISESYHLSQQMLFLDSLNTELQKLAYKDFYLKHDRNTSIPVQDNIESQIED